MRVRWVVGTLLVAAGCRPSPLDSSPRPPTSTHVTTDAGIASGDASLPAGRDGGTATDGSPPSTSAGDGGTATDGSPPPTSAGACAPPDPSVVRLLLPQSGSVVTSNQPRFVWTGATGPYQLQVCADRACNTVLLQSVTAANEMAFAQAIPPGYWFWRVLAQPAAGSTSNWTSAWEMRVRRRFPGYAPIGNTSVPEFSDYNGDGYPDVAVVGATPLIYLGGPDGLIADRVVPNVPDASTPMSLMAPQTDVNGDGFTDLSIAAVATFPGQSGGSYAAHVQFGASTGLSSRGTYIESYQGSGYPVGLGDFNGDGYGDLAMQYRYGADMMLGCVSQIAWAGLRCDACQVQQLATGDFDGDGRSDVVFADGGRISLYMGNPDSATWSAIAGISGLSVIDLDYDGFSDLVCPTLTGATAAYQGGPDGLSPAPSTSSLSRFTFALVGDFDGDGYWDAIGASGPQTTAGVLPPIVVTYGAPGGWGAPPTRTTTVDNWVTTSTAVVVDVNADGYDDVVVQAPGGTEMDWYAGSPAGLPSTPTGIITH
jgi:hypothetical protein